jgi:hypothetical protein
MSLSKLPKGGNSFRMSGVGGFIRKFSSVVRYGKFSNLQNNKDLAIKIFKKLVPTIRKDGKIPYSTRVRAARKFAESSKTTKQDAEDFKKILDNYK